MSVTSLTWGNVPGPLPLFCTASDGKLGVAWEWGYCTPIYRTNYTTCMYYLLSNILPRSLLSRTWWGGIVNVSPPWTTLPKTQPSGFPSSSSTPAGRRPLTAASPVTSEELLVPCFVLSLDCHLLRKTCQILCSVCRYTVSVCVSISVALWIRNMHFHLMHSCIKSCILISSDHF